jgi:hypothetical protein
MVIGAQQIPPYSAMVAFGGTLGKCALKVRTRITT